MDMYTVQYNGWNKLVMYRQNELLSLAAMGTASLFCLQAGLSKMQTVMILGLHAASNYEWR